MNKLFTTIACTLALIVNTSVFAANPKVEMVTTQGTVILELYPDKAPTTVENFLRYVKDEKYDGTVFHRVIKGFMNQGGGFTPEFKKVDTYAAIKNEADNGLKNARGTIAMARTGAPHSATNQFFVNTVDNDFLNHSGKSARGWGYCVFGKVIEGMDVMDKVAKMPTGKKGPFPKDVPQTDVVIQTMRVIEAAEKP
jgi:cyclophilin family peptidyl-prolyl cis-trans isomerase